MAIGQKGSQKYGLYLVLLLFVVQYALSKYLGLTVENIRIQVENTGFWSPIFYIAIFTAGEFIHLPGIVFVAVGILVYGKLLGFVLVFIASVISISFSFFVVRAIAGKPLSQIERPFFKKILARLDRQPIRVVVALRLFLFLSPKLNYALALTNVRFRDYLIGSTLGILLPLGGVSLLFDWVLVHLLG